MAFPLFLHPPTSLISNCLSLFSGTPHFSFIFLHPEGSKGGIRKGIKFWIERIITFMGELSFRGIQFQNHKDMPPKVIMWKKLCSSILHKTNQNPLKKKKRCIVVWSEQRIPSIMFFRKMTAATNNLLLDMIWLKIYFSSWQTYGIWRGKTIYPPNSLIAQRYI